ncbi:cytochrome oxidase assembly protein 3, mitochondrial, partial [Metschnikowia bicuspidata]
HARYRDPITGRITSALYRAREPFFWKNMLGFAVFGSIPLGVYIFTWKFLSKDDLSDIPIPPISDAELAELRKEYESK